MKKLFSIVAVLVAPTLAQAADSNASPSPNWTGFHLGGGAGLLFGSASTSASTDIAFFDCEGSCQAYNQSDSQDLTKQGWLGSIEAGYDYQLGSMVFGAGVDFDFQSKTVASVTFTGQDNQSPPNSSSQQVDVDFGDGFAVYGRIGALISKSTLVYGLAGYANQQAKLSSSLQAGNTDEPVFSAQSVYNIRSSMDGWTVGAGLEQLLGRGFSIKTEYRYADFGKISAGESHSSSDCTHCSYTLSSNAATDIRMQSVRMLLSYRF
jgi:outer membrane immunogenic protein